MNIDATVGLTVGAATAIGTFVAHECLEDDGVRTKANATFEHLVPVGVIGATAVAAAATIATNAGSRFAAVPLATLFGGLIGNLAGTVTATVVD